MSRHAAVSAFVIAALLALPATGLAGGFATAGLSSLPEDVRPGDEWVVDVTVLAHGVTPVEGVEPRVTIAREGAASAPSHVFAARPTDKAGVYRARVEFPTKGFWAISVDDGYTRVHEFGGVDIGDERTALAAATKFRPLERQARAPAASGEAGDGIDLGLALALSALAGLIVAAAVAARRVRTRPWPARG
jgi:hypothetical protein